MEENTGMPTGGNGGNGRRILKKDFRTGQPQDNGQDDAGNGLGRKAQMEPESEKNNT